MPVTKRADYWKSQAKKFCYFCKCWIADNKPSIEFHEKGKRHKENVAIRLKNISSQCLKEQKEKKKLDADLKKMEKAALDAYAKDVEANADYTSILLNEQLSHHSKEGNSSTLSTTCEEGSSKSSSSSKKTKISGQNVKSEIWYEALSDEGYTYYWNTETGESIWEQPDSGYVSIAKQKKLAEEEQRENDRAKARKERQNIEESRQKEEKERVKVEECRAYLEREKRRSLVKVEEPKMKNNSVIGPAPKGNPYGSWTTVEKCKPKPKIVDLQLPEHKDSEFKAVPITSESTINFKEKVMGALECDDSSDCTFKRRKPSTQLKRHLRQRLNDD